MLAFWTESALEITFKTSWKTEDFNVYYIVSFRKWWYGFSNLQCNSPENWIIICKINSIKIKNNRYIINSLFHWFTLYLCMTNYHMPNAINISKAIMEAMLKVRKTHCAYSKTLYEEDRSLFNCQVSTNIYHCIKDNRNRSIEICIQPVWVKPSKYQLYITGYIISYFTLINILLRHDTFRRISFCFTKS